MLPRLGMVVLREEGDPRGGDLVAALDRSWPDAFAWCCTDDPAVASRQVRAWLDERRPIATVTLLASRSSRPNARSLFGSVRADGHGVRMRTLWQTDEPDLDEALFAKNRLGVDRYIDAEADLVEEVSRAVALSLRDRHHAGWYRLTLADARREAWTMRVECRWADQSEPAGQVELRASDARVVTADPPHLTAQALRHGVLPFLLQALAATTWINRERDALRLQLPSNHAGAVRALGFQRTEDVSSRQGWAVFEGDGEKAPTAVHGTLETLAEVLEERGGLCFCGGLTRCFPFGYRSDRFGDLDVHCPRRASDPGERFA